MATHEPLSVNSASPFLAVGNCTLDDVVTPDGQISPRQLGGNAVYAAAGMRLWGADVSLVSVIGSDYPTIWLDQLAGAGIDVSAAHSISLTAVAPTALKKQSRSFPTMPAKSSIWKASTLTPAARCIVASGPVFAPT